METAKLEQVIYRTIDDIDFNGVYRNVVSFVQDDISNMLKNKDDVNAKKIINDFKIDASKLTSNDVYDYIRPDEDGKILINDEHYSIDKFVFKLVHFYTHELVNQEMKRGFRNIARDVRYINLPNQDKSVLVNMYKDQFHNKLHSILKRQPIAKKYNSTYNTKVEVPNYESKQEYIESCIHTSILVNYLTYCRGGNLVNELKA